MGRVWVLRGVARWLRFASKRNTFECKFQTRCMSMNSQPSKGGEREGQSSTLFALCCVRVCAGVCAVFPWLCARHGKNKYCIKMLESS